jgi:hypothetical protein
VKFHSALREVQLVGKEGLQFACACFVAGRVVGRNRAFEQRIAQHFNPLQPSRFKARWFGYRFRSWHFRGWWLCETPLTRCAKHEAYTE